MYSIDSLTISEYLTKLAAPNFPGPASGSAAATVAATAAALLEMSCAVTINKDEQKGEVLVKAVEKIKAIREHCLFLATEDMKAYGRVVKAIKLKQEAPEEYEAAMKNATETLTAIVEDCKTILEQIEDLVGICCVKVLGDLGGSAYLAEAAAAAAKQGVEVNLRLVQDQGYKAKILNYVGESYRNCLGAKDRIVAVIGEGHP